MNKKSFTLIELLVVIAIIGILSSLVIARFSDWGDNARIANTLQWSAGVHRTLGANLVGHWPLNGDVNDISGYDNNGQIVGDPTWVDGVNSTDNQALEFDGDNDYINIGNITVSDSFTVMAWVKVNVLDVTDNGILGRGENNLQFDFNDSQYLRIHCASGSYQVLTSQDDWDDGWHLASITYDGLVVGIYQDSTLLGEGNANIGGAFARIGSIEAGGREFKGSISDVRIYDTVLTAEEVGQIYAETKDSYLAYE